MSTSLVMMDTPAHVRRSAATSNASSASSADHHSHHHHLNHHIDIKPQAIVNANGSINFMKLFANATQNSNNNNQNSANNLHILNNLAQLQQQHQHHQHQPNGIAPTAPVTVKLENRVPSPCTADLANIKSEHPSGLPGPSVKDLSLFITKSAANNTQAGQQTLLTLNSSTMSATALDAINGLGPGALSLKHRRSVAAAESEASSGGSSAGSVFLSGQTLLPNGTHSPSHSPPPLLPNGGAGGGHFGRINGYATSGGLSSGKRDHDDAFGPSSTTTSATLNGSSISTTTPTMNVSSSMSSSNNNSLASLPSSTNSPSHSPPPLLTNGHGQAHLLNSNSNQHHLSHQAMVNSMMNAAAASNGGNTNIASPTSSSFSDFGSTGKEDMSPSNSVNGYAVDSLGGDPKKKKGPAPRQQEELCLVCGDRASGYHYNALTCEGCKGFFRRSITKNAVYQCKYGNNCEIDMYMRRKCQECRLKKCLSVGMRPECVVPEYQCAIKREAKRAIKDKDKPNSTTKDHGGLNGSIQSPLTPQASMLLEEKPLTPMTAVGSPAVHVGASAGWNGGPNGGASTPTGNALNGGGLPLSTPVTSLSMASPVGAGGAAGCLVGGITAIEAMNIEAGRRLSAEQEDVIKKLVYYQDEFESPSEDDIKKIAPFPLGENEDDSQKRFQHVTEMTILTVQLIVEFSKRVPFFDRLYREDQITLLKACSSEVMMLRCSRKYDIRTDSIVYANNQPYTRDNYSSASISYVADSLFNFCRRMCMLKVDNAEYALLTAIVIFSDRPALCEPRKVEEIQEHYIETLRCYVDSHRPPNKCHFAKLLGILTELRTLGNINSEMCVSLKVQNKKLPPFLAEIWDIQDA